MKSSPLRFRGLILICLFACGFTMISGRLVFLQLVSHDRYREKSKEMHFERLPISPRRGKILDRQGRVYAQSLKIMDLHIDGKLALESPERLAEVARVIKIEAGELKRSLSPKRRWQKIAMDLSEFQQMRLEELNLRYLIFEERIKRVYPNGQEACHVVGFTNQIHKKFPGHKKASKVEAGVQGIESMVNKYLTGIPGEQRVVKDRDQKEIPAYRQVDRRPLDGLNVVLSLDQGVQHILETEAMRIVDDFAPESVSIIAVKPSTGEILGMTNRPSFDPNKSETREPENLRNSGLMNLYEPGSIFKIVTLAAVLNERVADLGTPIFCENGEFFYADRYLRDSSPHGRLTVKQALAQSSNIAFAKLALQLRQDRLYRYIRQLGFGKTVQSTNYSLAGEQAGILRPPHYWSSISITRIPIGYEVATTNLQMTMAVAAIANEGKLMEPRFVQSIQDENGKIVKQFLPKVVRQVIRQDACEQVIQALTAVVSEGTGKAAAVSGLQIAGKTGTARKVINGQYAAGAYCSSFVGFFPAQAPEILVSVVVDYPKGDQYYSSQVAAPAFGRIASRIAQHLDIGLTQEPSPVVTARRPQ
ncbi:MAG: penicillin-binding protein 2 [Verrucomicrobiota bacterium]